MKQFTREPLSISKFRSREKEKRQVYTVKRIWTKREKQKKDENNKGKHDKAKKDERRERN